MKNHIYSIGILSSSLTIIGCLFKAMHWPGSGIILTLSLLFLVAIFFPLALANSYKSKGKKKTSLYLAVFFTSFLVFISALFKIMHWPGASIMLLAGILSPIFIFLPVYLYFYSREKEESITNFFYIIFLLVGISAMSGLMAINISKNILTDMIRTTEVTDLSEYYQLKGKVTGNNQMKDINAKAEDILSYIKKLKTEIVKKSGKENDMAISKQKEVIAWKITNLHIADAGATIIINNEAGKELKEKIDSYYTYLGSISSIENNNSTEFIDKLPNAITIEDIEDKNNSMYIPKTNDPLALTLLMLTSIENTVHMATLEAVSIIEKQQISKKTIAEK